MFSIILKGKNKLMYLVCSTYPT